MKGVQALGAVYGDIRDAAALLVLDEFEVHRISVGIGNRPSIAVAASTISVTGAAICVSVEIGS